LDSLEEEGAVKILAVAIVGLVLVWVAARALQAKRRRGNGWRVGHVGRDGMFYEELHDGKWERLDIDGEMLHGTKAHHVIYFATEAAWPRHPEWARGRRTEIVERIKSKFAPPYYEYLNG
jgi:hypothetical protein